MKHFCLQVTFRTYRKGTWNLGEMWCSLEDALERCQALFDNYGCWIALYELDNGDPSYVSMWPSLDKRKECQNS